MGFRCQRQVLSSLGLLAALGPVSLCLAGCGPEDQDTIPPPLDRQVVQDQDDMTWEDYRPIPGVDWADPSLRPDRGFRLAVVAIDFPDQPFVITLPRASDPFGNPQIDPVSRDQVPQFYADFWMTPSEVNHGQTINGYWMEQSRGRFGITEVDAYGPYRMPKPRWAYGLNEYGQNESTPDGSRANGRMERDCDSIWMADMGEDLRDHYDAVLRVYASYDETGVWQEFGEMKFNSREDIPAEWGNPDTTRPRWIPTRYVEWTSWLAGAQQWGLSSMRQGENSGTITHELGHYAFSLPDLNNNPYVEPYRRVAAGPWDMMDRGCFNGPGGPHRRWVVPPTEGAAMPAGLMVRNRIENGFLDEAQVLTLSREGLARSGPVVARVTARAVDPLPGTFAGIMVRLDGEEPHDRTPPDDPGLNPLSPGIPGYDFYSVEVVQRIGYDSFTPDEGVLIAKNKDSLRGRNGPREANSFNSYIWVIDAHPEDMNAVDYVKPDGTEVMRTIADYRQLNDALFHAGLNSGSSFEWTDDPNRLHFYVLDLERVDGILTYTLGIRSLDAEAAEDPGLSLELAPDPLPEAPGSDLSVRIRVDGSGDASASGAASDSRAAGDSALHPSDTGPYLGSDIVRLEATAEGEGWEVHLRNALAVVRPGETVSVPVYLTRIGGSAVGASAVRVTIQATSERDPSAISSASIEIDGSGDGEN